jgi:NADH dehydrogenase
VEIVEGDLYEKEEVARACAGVQAVIHLVGIIYATFADPFEKVHVAGTRAVIEGTKLAGVRRYVQMSALGTREGSRSQYHRTKWAAEEIVRASGLDWTILRPSLIFGPGDGFVTFLAKFLTFPFNFLNGYTFPRLGGGDSLFQPIAVENVAQAFVRSLAQSQSIGRTYDLCGEERLTLTEILVEIVGATGQQSQVEGFPLLTLARHGLWFGCLGVPLVLLPLAIVLHLGIPVVFVLAALWLGLVALAVRWTNMILFVLPWPLAFLLAVLVQNVWIFGNPLLTVDQLIMLQDGNVGDPGPAQRSFGLELLAFRTGIRRYLGGY